MAVSAEAGNWKDSIRDTHILHAHSLHITKGTHTLSHIMFSAESSGSELSPPNLEMTMPVVI